MEQAAVRSGEGALNEVSEFKGLLPGIFQAAIPVSIAESAQQQAVPGGDYFIIQPRAGPFFPNLQKAFADS
jgi:hypothetical protein